MLTILRVLDQHRASNVTASIASSIQRNKFKIIYVCVWSWTTRYAD